MENGQIHQGGRSMVEILGVLAVIGVLSIGGIAAYSKAMEKVNTNQLIVDISTTTRRIKNLYADEKNYETLDKLVFSQHLVEGAHQIDGMNKKLLHVFNGEVVVKSISYDQGFVIVYNGLESTACTMLASTDWGGSSTGLRFLVVSPTGIIPPRGFPSNLDYGEFKVDDLPLSPAEAAKFCHCDAFYKCGIAWFYK